MFSPRGARVPFLGYLVSYSMSCYGETKTAIQTKCTAWFRIEEDFVQRGTFKSCTKICTRRYSWLRLGAAIDCCNAPTIHVVRADSHRQCQKQGPRVTLRTEAPGTGLYLENGLKVPSAAHLASSSEYGLLMVSTRFRSFYSLALVVKAELISPLSCSCLLAFSSTIQIIHKILLSFLHNYKFIDITILSCKETFRDSFSHRTSVWETLSPE